MNLLSLLCFPGKKGTTLKEIIWPVIILLVKPEFEARTAGF